MPRERRPRRHGKWGPITTGTFDRSWLQWTWMTSGPQAHERIFDTSGRIVRYPLGGFVRDILYDPADRIASYIHCDAVLGATPAANALNQAFAYDEFSRVINVVTSGAWRSVNYDAKCKPTNIASSTSRTTRRFLP